MIVGMVKPRGARGAGRGRGRQRTQPSVIDTGLTLAQLEADADRMIGRASGIGEAIVAYRRGRDLVAAISAPERRALIGAACDAAVARGVDNDGRWRIDKAPDRRRQRLTSEAVRREQRQLWEASRPVAWTLVAQAPQAWVRPRALPPRTATVSALIASMRSDTRMGHAAGERADVARAVLIEAYQAIEALTPWGGDWLGTDDGWVIGWRAVPTFNATRCRAIAEADGIDVTPMVTSYTIGGYWRVVDRVADGEL